MKKLQAEQIVKRYLENELIGDFTVGIHFGKSIELEKLVIVKCEQYNPLGAPKDFYFLVDMEGRKIYNELLTDMVEIQADVFDVEDKIDEIEKEIFG